MTERKGPIAVLGITGRQGSAVARHLQAAGWQLRGLTRDASSPQARNLNVAGIELVEGDMADTGALDTLFRGVHGVFSVQPGAPLPTRESDELEAALGIGVAKAAARHGVKHFVYSSVLAADRQSDFRPKAKGFVESYIRSIALPFTIVRPGGFMEGYVDQAPYLYEGRLRSPLASDVRELLIATDDIGGIVSGIFAQRAKYLHETLEIAGDRLTPLEVASALSELLSTDIEHEQVAAEELMQISNILARLVAWLNTSGYPPVDFDQLRSIYPGLRTFREWLTDEGAARIQAASVTWN